MSCRIRLVLVIHNHQPIGNFSGVCEAAYHDSYVPFLDVLQDYPELAISLHNSGSLLEWIEQAHPEYIDRVRGLADRGQVEIVGGPYYEPILACIPRRDRVGQITTYSKHLEQTFGVPVRGIWVPERVWEQSFAGDIARSGIEYTVLDDHHFKNAGLSDAELHGYYLTEDEGRLLKIFPGCEQLRYTIPFADPQRTIDHLRQIAERSPGAVVTFGDDGEKFGTWPGTKEHVYQNGWLRRFFDALRANRDWLSVCTMGEAVDQVAPVGSVYIPDGSYREMTEWVLPTNTQVKYFDMVHRQEREPGWPEVKQFLRGGFWRNFRVKYPEANDMYARMMEVSQRLDTAIRDFDVRTEAGEQLAEARQELYRAQCNCSYWHGAFGGLYLPHLRNAVYRHLVAADTLLEQVAGRTGRWVDASTNDYNLDARQEVRLASDRLVAYLAPARGGHLYELDVRTTKLNLLATLNRRPEAYHEKIRQAAAQQHGGHQHAADGTISSIHDLVRCKEPDLDKKIGYDHWERKSLVDHFLQPGLSLDTFMQGAGSVGDFVSGVYDAQVRRTDERVEVVLTRDGHLGPYKVKVAKTVSLDRRRGGVLETRYDLSQLPAGVPIHFGVEYHFAGMAAGQPDRYFYNALGHQLGQLQSILTIDPTERLGLIDEWLGLDAALDCSLPASFWTFPIQTISQSEGGFELVHQSTAVIPHWEFTAPADGCWSVTIALSLDTSVAQARALRESAAAHAG